MCEDADDKPCAKKVIPVDVGTAARSIGLGLGWSTFATLTAGYVSPSPYVKAAAALSGILIGFLNHLSEVSIKHHRGMIAADAESNAKALKDCRDEVDELKERCRTMELKIEAIRTKAEVDQKELIDKFLHRDAPHG